MVYRKFAKKFGEIILVNENELQYFSDYTAHKMIHSKIWPVCGSVFPFSKIPLAKQVHHVKFMHKLIALLPW